MYGAAIGRLQSGYHPKRRRFATTARPQKGQHLSFGDVDRQVSNGVEVSEILVQLRQLQKRITQNLLFPLKSLCDNCRTAQTFPDIGLPNVDDISL